MKIKLTFLFAVLCLTGFSQVEFAPIGAEWYYSRNEGLMPPDVGYTVYKVTKDTIIEGKTVRVIRKTYHHANGVIITELGNEYLYEEDKRVYCWINKHFYLLYDFNAQPGETWTIYGNDNIGNFCNYDSLGVVVVDSVKTLKINGYDLKALYTSPSESSNWGFNGVILEHIGCVTHILPQAKECVLDIPHENGPLRCYEDNIFGKYKTDYWDRSNFECDVLFYYTSVKDDEFGSINIFPNPVEDYLNFQLFDIPNKSENFQIEVLNINGNVIKTVQITDKVFVGDFLPGIYLLRISISPQVLCF
jgi:hypothetical protein